MTKSRSASAARLIVGLLATGTAVQIVSGCQSTLDFTAPGAGGTQQSASGSAAGLAAFQSSFYPYARANCVACHGTSQVPLFAIADATKAYVNALASGAANFADIPSSRFVSQANNGHCGGSMCKGKGNEVLPLIQHWAEQGGEVGGTPGPTSTVQAQPFKYLTAALPVPNPLPSAIASPTYMRWQMSDIKPALVGLKGAVLELEIAQMNPSTYRIKNLKLGGLKGAVQVKGVHIVTKATSDTGFGTEDSSGTYWTVDNVNVDPVALPSPLPTKPMTTLKVIDPMPMPVLIVKSPTQDSIAIGFDDLLPPDPTLTPTVNPSPGASPSATPSTTVNMATYAYLSVNVFSPKCVGCHSANNMRGGADLSSYAGVKAFVTAGDAGNSTLYKDVSGAGNLMPLGGPALPAATVQAIATWINNGALNN